MPASRSQNVVPPEKLKNWVVSYLPFVIGSAKSKRIGPIGEFQIRLTPTDVRIRFGSHTLAQLDCVIGNTAANDPGAGQEVYPRKFEKFVGPEYPIRFPASAKIPPFRPT